MKKFGCILFALSLSISMFAQTIDTTFQAGDKTIRIKTDHNRTKVNIDGKEIMNLNVDSISNSALDHSYFLPKDFQQKQWLSVDTAIRENLREQMDKLHEQLDQMHEQMDQLNAQKDELNLGNPNNPGFQGDTINRKIQGEIPQIEKNKDTTLIKLGKKSISIVEQKDGTTTVKINDASKENADKPSEKTYSWGKKPGSQKSEEYDKNAGKKFKGHWRGFELAMNNFVDKDFSLSRTVAKGNEFMDLNTSKSWDVNINLFQKSFSLYSDKIGFVTGLGLELNNYRFENDNSIKKDVNGIIIEDDLSNIKAVGSIQKSKLATTFITLPLTVEFQIPTGKNRIYFNTGLIGGLKLGSHTKVVYKENGDRQKDKNHDDFNISPLRYGLTGRLGYKSWNVFCNYYLTPFFEKDKGPELYPFAVGLALSFN